LTNTSPWQQKSDINKGVYKMTVQKFAKKVQEIPGSETCFVA
jgi:hypothetical protein